MAMFTRIPEYSIKRQYELSYQDGIQLIKQLLKIEDNIIEAFTELSSTVRGYSFGEASCEARRLCNKDVVMVQGIDGDEDWFYVVEDVRHVRILSIADGFKELGMTMEEFLGSEHECLWELRTIDCPDDDAYEGRLIDGQAWFLLPGIGFIINR